MAGIAPGDHVCACFGSDDEHQAIVGRYACRALERHERFLYLAECQYDRRLFEPEVLDRLVATHEFQLRTGPEGTTANMGLRLLPGGIESYGYDNGFETAVTTFEPAAYCIAL